MLGCRVLSAFLVAFGLTANLAYASSSSEMYRTEAMFLLSDEDYTGALSKLDQAVTADPNDMHARYYRGIALSRIGRYAAAAQDLQRAYTAAVAYRDLPFELGYAQYRLNQLAKAQATLQQAVRERPAHASSYYYLALVRYKQKDYAACLNPFSTAAKLDNAFGASSAYMRAEALVHLKRYDEAGKLLLAGIRGYPDSIYTGPMKELNAQLEEARSRNRWVTLHLGVGTTYDNNVGLFANDTALPADINSGSDYRVGLNAGAGIKVEPVKDLRLKAGYNIFRSQHRKLSQYDVASYGPYLSLRRDLTENLGLTVNYQFRASQLNGEDYTDMHVLAPSLAWRHGKNRFSSIRAQWRDVRYQQQGQDVRDGRYQELGYYHYWMTGQGNYYYLGGMLARDNTKDADYDYRSAGLETGIQRRLKRWRFKGRFKVENKNYYASSDNRKDRHFETDVSAIYPLGKHVQLDIGLTYIQHPSSSIYYDYTRTVITTAVKWRL